MADGNFAGRICVRTTMRASLVCLVLLIVATAASAEPHPLAVRALKNLDAFDDDVWSYTRTTKAKDGLKIERHDASKPKGERWTLLRIDGRAPTAREQEEFRREKAELEKRREKRDDDNDVDLESIRLQSETPQRATFTFRTKAGGGLESKMAEKIAGTLVVSKDGGWAERFELRNTGTIAPVPGMNVSRFRLTMTFQRHGGTNEIVPEAIELSMRGRAFLVKSLDEERSTQYSDFVRIR